jgi:hypothetical protein
LRRGGDQRREQPAGEHDLPSPIDS